MKTANTPQNYGANEIKSVYKKNLRRGLEIAIFIHALFISGYILVNYINNANADDIKKKTFEIKYVDIDVPPSVDDNDEKVEIQKVEDIIKPVKDLGALVPDPVARDKAEQMTIKTQDELDNIKSDISKTGDSNVYVSNNNTNIGNIDKTIIDKTDKHDIKIEPDKNYTGVEVEKMPECVNFEQVRGSMVYPNLAIEAGIEGKVTVKVLVGQDGKVIRVGSISGPDIFYDEVREKVTNLEFTPGLLNNNAVKVWVNVPFTFKLKNK
jgi:protein TonB